MSELVDQITLSEGTTPESIKKEIVINLGDLVARENAAEAIRIAENAQNASGRAEAIANDVFKVTGPPTDNGNSNLIILACSLNNEGVPSGFTSEEETYFWLHFSFDSDSNLVQDTELEDYEGNIYTLVEGYNSIHIPWLGARLEMLVSFDALHAGYIETDWLDHPSFNFVNTVVSSQLSATIMAAVRMSQPKAEPIPVTEYTNSEVVNSNVQEIYFPYSNYSFEVEDGKLLIYKGGLLVAAQKLKQGFNHLSFTDGNYQIVLDIIIKSDVALANIEGEAFELLSPARLKASSPIIYAYYQAIDEATKNAVNEVAYPLAKEAASNEIFFEQLNGNGFPKMAYMLDGASYFKIEREVSLADNANIFRDNKVKDVLYLDCSGVANIGGSSSQNSIFDCSSGKAGKNAQCLRSVVMGKGTINNVKYLFKALQKLEFLNVINIDASAVESLLYTFCECFRLKKIDLRNWGFRKVKDLRCAFFNNQELEELYIPNDICADDTIGIIQLGKAFINLYKLKRLDLSMFSGKKANDSTQFIFGCHEMTDIDFGEIDFSDIAESDKGQFGHCYALVNFSGMLNMPVSYSLGDSPLLSHDSAMNCINRLYDLTEGGTKDDYTPQTLTFHPDVTAQLTEDEIEVATSKGWTIA